MRTPSLARRSSLILCVPLIPVLALGTFVAYRTKQSLDEDVRQLEAARQVKELSRSSLALLLTQEAVTKAMLIDPEDMSGASRKLKAYDENTAVLKSMAELSRSPKVLSIIEQLKKIESEEMQPADTAVLEALGESGEEAAKKAYFSTYEPVRARYEHLVRELAEVAEVDANQASKQMVEANQSALLTTCLSLFSVIVVVAIAGLVMARQVSKRALRTAAVLGKVAGGDLTQELDVGRNDELGQMADALNNMVASLHGAVTSFGAKANRLTGASGELSSVSEQMASSARDTARQATLASEAASAVSENVRSAATGVSEISATIADIARSATDAARIAASAVELSERANTSISKLAQSSQEIGEFVKVINSIAEQTNLLALNATIEAARAGDAGKGFAVVANEVKELAKETARATEDISRRIEGIRTDTRGATEVIASIGGVIAQIDEIQCTIAAAVEEQAATARAVTESVNGAAGSSAEIAGNVNAVAQAGDMTTQCASVIEDAAGALASVAVELRTLVEGFTVDGGSDGPSHVGPRPTRSGAEGRGAPTRFAAPALAAS
jgi:methyl-accepting chemotaxis protein